ncbi:unnamed protein product [Blepharisma stoltei]|uniref:Rab-GAP TBC domain-containing protein n=1 Tax=Blepharisma stoltei TaxID=1481888 RepID=A0AAU9K7S3_9CILI|nr:unnamed protein product [Blepharisma stoltei]
MSLKVEKLRIIKDIEGRLNDETSNITYLKATFMQTLQQKATENRDVRFSELLYDESLDLIKNTIEEIRKNPISKEFNSQVKRIYNYRIKEARQDTLFEVTESPWILHSECVGNILEFNSVQQDLLKPFHNKALQKHLRKNIWRALLTYPKAEEEYFNLFKENRWKTISRNEVEITKKSVDLLSEHCPALAFNDKVVMAMKVLLSYMEKVVERRLPEFIYYLMLPIMYTLPDLASNLPKMVGIGMKIFEIQTTVWTSEKGEGIIFVFLNRLREVNPQLAEKFEKMCDIRFQENKEKLENFLRPFLSRLGSGFFNIETTCFVYDQLIMKNSVDLMYYFLAIALHSMSDRILGLEHWDDFVEMFYKEMRRIRVEQLEALTNLIPNGEVIEEKAVIPSELKGQEYLNFVVKSIVLASKDKKDRIDDMGELISTRRVLADDPVTGLMHQKLLKGNLMENMINSRRETPLPRLEGTLLDMTRESFRPHIAENRSIDDSFNKSRAPDRLLMPEKLLEPRSRGEKTNNPLLISDMNESSIHENSQDRKFDKGEAKSMQNALDKSAVSEKLTKSMNDGVNKSKDPANKQKHNKTVIFQSSQPPPDNSYLKNGIFCIPDLDNLKPGLFDKFID